MTSSARRRIPDWAPSVGYAEQVVRRAGTKGALAILHRCKKRGLVPQRRFHLVLEEPENFFGRTVFSQTQNWFPTGFRLVSDFLRLVQIFRTCSARFPFGSDWFRVGTRLGSARPFWVRH